MTADSTATRDTVLAVLAEIAPEIDPATIDGAAPLREDLDLDSLDFQRLLAGVDDRLAIAVPEEDYDQVDTLDALVAYLVAAS